MEEDIEIDLDVLPTRHVSTRKRVNPSTTPPITLHAQSDCFPEYIVNIGQQTSKKAQAISTQEFFNEIGRHIESAAPPPQKKVRSDPEMEDSFPPPRVSRYFDAPIDQPEIPAQSIFDQRSVEPSKPPNEPSAPVEVCGFEVSRIKVVCKQPFNELRVRGTSEQEIRLNLASYTVQFRLDRTDNSDVDVLKNDGSHKVPKTLYNLVAQEKRVHKDSKSVVFVVKSGFRFRECIEYKVLWLEKGIERELAVGIVRLADILTTSCSYVSIQLKKADYFRSLPTYDKYYADHNCYKIVVHDQENNSLTSLYGRKMVDWDDFLPNPIPISTTSRIRRGQPGAQDDEESESSDDEEEEVVFLNLKK